MGEKAVAAEKSEREIGVITYVLARNESAFLIWLKGCGGGRSLQSCKSLVRVEQMKGLDFSSPARELLVINGWDTDASREKIDEGYRVISRYCHQKRVHDVPTAV